MPSISMIINDEEVESVEGLQNSIEIDDDGGGNTKTLLVNNYNGTLLHDNLNDNETFELTKTTAQSKKEENFNDECKDEEEDEKRCSLEKR